jgi:hypothetical protein
MFELRRCVIAFVVVVFQAYTMEFLARFAAAPLVYLLSLTFTCGGAVQSVDLEKLAFNAELWEVCGSLLPR